MTITEILEMADRLVLSQTGKHLDNLQEAVIKGVWQGQTYQVIADECQHSESRVRDVGYKLWEILSEQLKEDIHKSNFISVLKRLQLKLSEFNIDNIQSIHNVRVDSCLNQYSNDDRQAQSNQQQPYCNLKQAPKITHCYGRENELLTLSQWLESPNINLISVLGIAGIGKSTLVRSFLEFNAQFFDIIIWKNLKLSQSFNFNITEILTDIHAHNNNSENILNKFMNLLNQKRCLIILDNIQEIFIPEQLAGMYKPEYQDYQKLFTMITETNNQSYVILISQEKCKEMECLDEELYPIKCLELSGLNDREILTNMGLKDEDSWLDLINLYEGNPFYLKTIANSIKNIYDGNVSDFLAENQDNCSILPVIPTQIQTSLQLLFKRLSPIEQQIVIKLSNSDQLLSREELKTTLDLSSTDLINSLESLQQRYLVTKITEDKIRFKLDSVFREYGRNCYQN
jgi:hypothetical protein